MLAIHSEVQRELLADISRVCGDQEPTYEQLNDLTMSLGQYTQALQVPPLIS